MVCTGGTKGRVFLSACKKMIAFYADDILVSSHQDVLCVESSHRCCIYGEFKLL